MTPALKVLVVGGNGFIGSAVCRLALARGFEVTSISTSGSPYQTAKGHRPDWTSNVKWIAASALEPVSYASLLNGAYGVVHTLGTLFENTEYKSALKSSDGMGLAQFLLDTCKFGSNSNPLREKRVPSITYDAINKDSALRVCETFIRSDLPSDMLPTPRPFVYISAEDVFRPAIPERYITSKREAETGIQHLMSHEPNFRPVFIRPSLVYHAHHRPLTSPAAALLDLSASLHAKAPSAVPTPSSVLRSLGSRFSSNSVASSPLESIANALTIPPIHVDHVAEAICTVLDPLRGKDIRGIMNVSDMRRVIGWEHKGKSDGGFPASQQV